ncbi:MAG: chromate resistance protein, partial [Caldilineaceae bacterium]|nr:chromate resistance protein [Caldilineaceae bacterium]
IAKYTIDAPGLSMMADIVRAADRKLTEPAEGAGVAAMSHGFAMLELADEEVLRLQLPMWEALYAYCQSRA